MGERLDELGRKASEAIADLVVAALEDSELEPTPENIRFLVGAFAEGFTRAAVDALSSDGSGGTDG